MRDQRTARANARPQRCRRQPAGSEESQVARTDHAGA